MGGRKPAATVSGPGLDRGYESPQIGLSAAITFATRAAGATTIYVRTADGAGYGYVERHDDGSLSIQRTKGEKR